MQASFSLCQAGSRYHWYVLPAIVLLFPSSAHSDFWSLKDKEPLQTVTLTRVLPPVAARKGRTVQFQPEIAGGSIPSETAVILREKIRTLLMNSKGGAIQVVDGPADTVIKCIVTGYEQKNVHSNQRQVGNQHLQLATWVGNIEASVQILDRRNNPIDAANLKFHLENDFVVAQREDNPVSLTDKRTSWRDKVAGGLKSVRGGFTDVGDLAGMAGGGKQIHDALSAQDKGARPPTDLEWRDALIEGLATKVANRIVPVDQSFVAVLPLDKDFAEARDLAKASHWGEVEERMEKMPALQGPNEAYRLYLLGLSYEALACSGSASPKDAAEQLNLATKYYDDAHKARPNEHELFLAQIRAQDSLDHFLEIQHARDVGAALKAADPEPSASESGKPAETAADNAALIEMVKAKMQETVLVTYVQTAGNPKFDISAHGLIELSRNNVPSSVIAAVQKRMSGTAPARRASAPAPRKRSASVPSTH